MKITTIHRGHRLVNRGLGWRYEKDGKRFDGIDRKCIRCGQLPKNGHDYCIANLPNVKFACCGHGKEEGYFVTNTDIVIRFSTGLKRDEIIELIKVVSK